MCCRMMKLMVVDNLERTFWCWQTSADRPHTRASHLLISETSPMMSMSLLKVSPHCWQRNVMCEALTTVSKTTTKIKRKNISPTRFTRFVRSIDLSRFYRAKQLSSASWDHNSVRLSVCPSVCPSVTRVLCDETIEHTADILIPHELSLIHIWRCRRRG